VTCLVVDHRCVDTVLLGSSRNGVRLPSTRVARALDQIIEWRGKPTAIRCDNGPEYISQILADWADEQGIRL
jgi:transposase InsO family protein